MCEPCNAAVPPELLYLYVDELDLADWLLLCEPHAQALVSVLEELDRARPASADAGELDGSRRVSADPPL